MGFNLKSFTFIAAAALVGAVGSIVAFHVWKGKRTAKAGPAAAIPATQPSGTP